MSRPAPGTAISQGVLYSALPSDLTGMIAPRGAQLADQLAGRITYGADPEAPTVALDGGPFEPATADLVRRAWSLTHDGMGGQSVPTSADLDDAATILAGRATVAARQAAEQRVIAEDARARVERVDGAALAAATAARRAALQAELAAMDEPDPTGPPRRPWRRSANTP